MTPLGGENSINCLSGSLRNDSKLFARASEWLAEARSVAVLTGAAISAESGIPTFRGAGGLWRDFRPEELATPEAFARDPKLVWEWYDWRRGLVAKAEPNAGQRALVVLERQKPEFTLVTQNVDGLHDRAGNRHIVKLHGDLWQVRCVDCEGEHRDVRVPLEPLPPRCFCGGLLRPGVVWFGEPLPERPLSEAFEAASRAEIFLVLGTSSVVFPAAALPQAALARGRRVVEINLEPTSLSAAASMSLRGKVGEILPALVGSLA